MGRRTPRAQPGAPLASHRMRPRRGQARRRSRQLQRRCRAAKKARQSPTIAAGQRAWCRSASADRPAAGRHRFALVPLPSDLYPAAAAASLDRSKLDPLLAVRPSNAGMIRGPLSRSSRPRSGSIGACRAALAGGNVVAGGNWSGESVQTLIGASQWKQRRCCVASRKPEAGAWRVQKPEPDESYCSKGRR